MEVIGMLLSFCLGSYVVDRMHRRKPLFPEIPPRAKVVQHTDLDKAMHSRQMMIKSAKKLDDLRKQIHGQDH